MMELYCIASESSRLRQASSECATLMDLLAPYCGEAWQSPLTDLTPSPLIYPSHKDKTDPVDVSPSNHPIMANRNQKTRVKNRKSAREREMGIDLIRYTAVCRFGRAQQLNTLK